MKSPHKIILISLLFLSVFATAQNSVIDSLIKLTSTAIPDSQKIKLYGDISWEYLNTDIDKALEFGKKELELAVKTNNLKEQGQAESDIGSVFNRLSLFDSALVHYQHSVDIRTKLKLPIKLAGVYSNMATVYMRQNKYKEALDIYFKSLKIFEEINDLEKQSLILGNIGNIYHEFNQETEALNYHRRSLGLAMKYGKNKNLIGNILVNFGTVKYSLKDLDSSLYYFQKAREVYENAEILFPLGAVYNNLGKINADKKMYDKAVSYYNMGLQNRIGFQDTYGIGSSALNLGEMYYKIEKYDSAMKYLSQSAEIFEELKSYLILKQSYGSMAMVYEAKGDLHNALVYYQKYSNMKDSVFTQESSKVINELNTKYETEKKDLLIAKTAAELEIQQEKSFKKNIIIASVLALLILILLLGYSFTKRKQIQQKAMLDAELAKQKEMRSKAVIEAEEKERARIAQDLHDGVGQTLSAAKLNLSGLEAAIKFDGDNQKILFKNAIDLVDESVKEVRAVSHNMMPNTLIKLGLAMAVREFITKLSSLPNLKVDLEIVGLDERLEQQVESVLYRVIQETVNNIIKHAKANHITMQLIKHESEITVMIEDNGVGFDTAIIRDSEGLGLKGIISRIEFLSGRVDFDSAPGKGTTVVMEIPLN